MSGFLSRRGRAGASAAEAGSRSVLITGAASGLGLALTREFLALGDEVVCVDNLFTGTKRNIEHLHGNPRFEFIRHDVTFPLYI